MHLHASGIAHDALHRHAQAGIQPVHDFLHILARTTGHGEPLRPVAHLDEAVVMAKTDHGGHWKAQHLVGRAAPDAAQHGQEIPVAKGRAKAVLYQKIAQGLGQRRFFTRFGQGGTQLVKAQQLAQHAPKARAQQIAALGKHRGQVRATPLQRLGPQRTCAGHLHRKRHVRMGAGHLQLIEQSDQAGIRALVEHQKARVHTMGDRAPLRIGQRHIHRVRVATKVVADFKQADPCLLAQPVGGGQTRNSRTNDSNFHSDSQSANTRQGRCVGLIRWLLH